ncbi:MAG: hypothetical protein KGS45_14155 [Planctomycetes bacterium]|nr:hypothetical protein [Planctomycetota bacterium]
MFPKTNSPRFESIRKAARLLGVPIVWLKNEAKSGRIPSLSAGKRILIDVEAADRVLTERANRRGGVQ